MKYTGIHPQGHAKETLIKKNLPCLDIHILGKEIYQLFKNVLFLFIDLKKTEMLKKENLENSSFFLKKKSFKSLSIP